MFWKYNNTSSPHFEAVLQKEGVTLQELMEEEDIIQECKLQNKKLVEFLCQRNILEELVTLITEEPSEELDERSRYKYPNIACELLTCDVPALNESLSRDNALLEKLYSFIDKDPPLNPLLASFLSRTLGVLIVKRLDQAMGFLKDKENFISLLLKHLGTSAIMDLTLKLITEVGDVEHRQNLLNWLDSQKLIQSLVALFDPKVDSERHHNSAQLLCDVLRISREAMADHRERMDTDPILARLESPETVALLLDQILGPVKSETSIVGGIQVLLALLGQKNSFNDNNLAYNNTYDETEIERRNKVAQSTALVIVRRLKDFHQILLDPPKKVSVRTCTGGLEPAVGRTRLQVSRLVAALLAANHADVLRDLLAVGTLEVLLDMFFNYVWNNFLHTQVQHCIAAALAAHVKLDDTTHNTDNAMYPYLIIKCRLLGRILEAWDDNEQKQTKPKGVRQGYMGHLINIANEIVQQCESSTSLDTFIKEAVSKDTMEAWSNFVNGSLADANKTQRVVLGGIHPSSLTSDDSNEDYNIPYPQSAILHQQMYSEFQMQQMTPDLIENYGFHDDEFGDADDPINRQAEMFKKVCSEYINTLDDADDSIFEEQGQGAIRPPSNTATPTTATPTTPPDTWDPRDDTTTTLDTPSPPPPNTNTIAADMRMDVDPWLSMACNRSTIALIEPSDPWSNLDSSSGATTQDGWADFETFAEKYDSPVQITTSSDSINNSSEYFVSPSPSGEQNVETSVQNKSPSESSSKPDQILQFDLDSEVKETASIQDVTDNQSSTSIELTKADATPTTLDMYKMPADAAITDTETPPPSPSSTEKRSEEEVEVEEVECSSSSGEGEAEGVESV